MEIKMQECSDRMILDHKLEWKARPRAPLLNASFFLHLINKYKTAD